MPHHAALDVHHVAVVLDHHQILHPHASRLAHTTQIITPEVHQHYVLGTLLGVGQ